MDTGRVTRRMAKPYESPKRSELLKRSRSSRATVERTWSGGGFKEVAKLLDITDYYNDLAGSGLSVWVEAQSSGYISTR